MQNLESTSSCIYVTPIHVIFNKQDRLGKHSAIEVKALTCLVQTSSTLREHPCLGINLPNYLSNHKSIQLCQIILLDSIKKFKSWAKSKVNSKSNLRPYGQTPKSKSNLVVLLPHQSKSMLKFQSKSILGFNLIF